MLQNTTVGRPRTPLLTGAYDGLLSANAEGMRETNRDRQREATKRRLFEASLKEIAEHGLERASVDAVTTAAGTSRTAYYFHFPKKEAVLEVLAQQFSSGIACRLEALRSPTLEELLGAFNECVNEFWAERRRLAAETATVWLGERPNGQVNHALLTLVHKAITIDPNQAIQLVDQLVISHWIMVLKWGLGGIESLEAALRTLTDIFLFGATGSPRRSLRLVTPPGRSPLPSAAAKGSGETPHGRPSQELASARLQHAPSSRRDAS